MQQDLSFDLGGHKVYLSPFPWRAVRALQPALFALNAKINGEGNGSIAGLNEADLEQLAGVVFSAMQHHEIGSLVVTREEFDDLPISSADLMRALPAIARAAGLIPRKLDGAAEAASDAGK